jgi:hypothetical protein
MGPDVVSVGMPGEGRAADCLALVRALKMIMLKELSNRPAQRGFTKEDELR